MGFAVLATPLFLLFADPPRAIQLVIIITAALSLVVLPGLRRAIAARLLLRLALGSLAGLPLGLFAFRYADPIVVRGSSRRDDPRFCRASRVATARWHGRGPPPLPRETGPRSRGRRGLGYRHRACRDGGAAGADLPAGAAPRTVQATLLSFFALTYAASLASHVVTVGIPARTWLSAGVLIPFAFLGGLAGRPLGDRLGADAFAILAILLLGAAGLCTLAAAAGLAVH